MNRALLISLIAFFGQLPVAQASHICWVERATDVGGMLHVVMRQGYEQAVRGASGPSQARVELRKNADGSFDLNEGETVLLSTTPHDSCLGTSIKRDGRLVLELKATNCAPGLKCVQAAAVVSD